MYKRIWIRIFHPDYSIEIDSMGGINLLTESEGDLDELVYVTPHTQLLGGGDEVTQHFEELGITVDLFQTPLGSYAVSFFERRLDGTLKLLASLTLVK